MKLILAMITASMIVTAAFAEQIVLVVQCRDGQAQTGPLESRLRDGWRVVSAVPVLDSNSISMVGKAKQGYTASIVYVLEKN